MLAICAHQTHRQKIHQKIHHQLSLMGTSDFRELKIIACILMGYISHFLVFSYEYGHHEHYTYGFFRSFVYFLICGYIAHSTLSLRIVGLMVLIVVSMLGDLAFVYSDDWYYYLTYYRYQSLVNFKDIYALYEAICVLFALCYWVCAMSRKKHDSCNDDDLNGGSYNPFSDDD